VQHDLARSERMGKLHETEFLIAASAKRIECAAHGVELTRGCALKRKNRLLLVADGKDRALDCARAGPGEKLVDQPADDAPLLRAGVLRLVDQHVIDAEVELVVHPRRLDAL